MQSLLSRLGRRDSDRGGSDQRGGEALEQVDASCAVRLAAPTLLACADGAAKDDEQAAPPGDAQHLLLPPLRRRARVSDDSCPGPSSPTVRLAQLFRRLPRHSDSGASAPGPPQQQATRPRRHSEDGGAPRPSALGFRRRPRTSDSGTAGGIQEEEEPPASSGPAGARCKPAPRLQLGDLPPPALFAIYSDLGPACRRSLRLAVAGDRLLRHAVSRCVRCLSLGPVELARLDLARLPALFPELNSLELSLTSAASSSSSSSSSSLGAGFSEADSLAQLAAIGGRLPHLNSFATDAKVRGAGLQAVCRFLQGAPRLRHLSLSNQRAGSPADQRALALLLEGAGGLQTLDLGGSGSSSASAAGSSSGGDGGPLSGGTGRRVRASDPGSYGGAAAASSSSAVAVGGPGSSLGNGVSLSVFKRICNLRHLRSLSCNAAAVPEEQLGRLVNLAGLQSLSLTSAGSGEVLAIVLGKLGKLACLELEQPSTSGELLGAIAGLTRLRVLALGLCPRLKDGILEEVSTLQALAKLTLPFPLGPSHLRLLSRLPGLQELFSWRSIELDVLGLAHEPLAKVTKLVASTIVGRGKPLAAWFPALECLYLKRCGDAAALSLPASVGLTTLVAGDCGQLSDEGFAAWRSLRGLQRLQLEGAVMLSDASFAAVFSQTMPVLTSLSLAGAQGVTDRGLQLLTASCRRLGAISLAGCGQLSDKTLSRLAHCEHLSSAALRACRGLTAAGVCRLAAAPRMRSLAVSACPGVCKAECTGFRPGVRVRVD